MTMLIDCLANIASISLSFSCPVYFSLPTLLPIFLFSHFCCPILWFYHLLLVFPLHYSSCTLLRIHVRSCLSFTPLSTSSLSHWCLFQLLIPLAQLPLRAISAVMLQHPKLTQEDWNVISVRAH